MTTQPIKISGVLYPEGDHWVGQCLEMDITAQAKTLPELPGKLMKNIVANVVIAHELNRDPLEAIAAAPEKFWKMFQHAKNRFTAELMPMRGPDFIPAIESTLKVADNCGFVKLADERIPA